MITKTRDALDELHQLKTSQDPAPNIDRLENWLTSISKTEVKPQGEPTVRDYIVNVIRKTLHDAGISSGSLLELGGPHNSMRGAFPEFDYHHLSLFPTDENTIVGDATNCPHVPNESFDGIVSVSVFEHIAKPWLAAENITRLLKPGGVTVHMAPFSYFYHGAPADFYRYTPDAFAVLFPDLKQLQTEFYGRNRRRDNRGSVACPVDRDGGEQFAIDALGGWRENWQSIYAGQKDSEFAAEKLDQAHLQTVVNLMKMRTESGIPEAEAAKDVARVLKSFQISIDQDLHPGASARKFKPAEVLHIWQKRGKLGLRPAYNRFVQAKIVGW